jgi:uncharacterized caspase-like protein
MKKFSGVLIFCLALTAVTAQEQKGDLWVLAVGINAYTDNPIFPNLKFCVSDAKNICDAFKAQEGKAFNKVNTLLISDTEAIKPAKNNILSNMAFLRDAKPNDTVILYFALHSMTQDNNFYLLPSDIRHEKNDRLVSTSMINFTDIINSFNVPGKKIMLLDTHYSETAIRLATGKNIAVLGACKDNEQAHESPFFQGGFFTVSFLDALREGATANDTITLGTLSTSVKDRVGKMSRGRQNPVWYLPPGMGDPVLVYNR